MKSDIISKKSIDVKKLMKALKSLPHKNVLVGIPSDKSNRKAEVGEKADITNAELGYIHEYGAPEKNIPARPFLIPGVEEVKPQVIKYFKEAGKAAVEGNITQIEKYFHMAGLAAQNTVRAKINNGDFEPLSEVTLRLRRSRGRTGTRPLIDTGQLRNSITYVIRNKE